MCVGYQAFAFVVDDFDILSAVTMCPMAGKYRLANRSLSEFFYLMTHKLYKTMIMEAPDKHRGGPCCMV